MAVEFSVPLARPMALPELSERARAIMGELLGQPAPIEVDAAGAEGLGASGDRVTFRVGDAAEATVMVFDLPFDDYDLAAVEPGAVISAGRDEPAVSIALAIAVSIAVAELARSAVIDDSQWLSEDLRAEPSRLLNRLRAAKLPPATGAPPWPALTRAARELVARTGLDLGDADPAAG
jgi:hypothetical protein